jgi:hypothetical protein
MAFSKGNESTEGAQVKRYIGLASVFVKGVNLSMEEIDKFYGRQPDPERTMKPYVDTEKGRVRIDFFVEADPKSTLHPDIEFKSKVTFFLSKEARVNKDGTKKQIIDKYGRTAWATQAEIDAHQIPMYANGPANISPDYHVARDGEEDLIKFLIAYLAIDSVQKYVDGKWVMISNDPAVLENCEASLEHIDDYFKGDFKELRDILSYQPMNKLKVLFGISKNDQGVMYQNAYTRMFLKNKATTYSSIEKNLNEAKLNGAYPATEFEVGPLHEYTVEATVFDKPTEEKTPWDN